MVVPPMVALYFWYPCILYISDTRIIRIKNCRLQADTAIPHSSFIISHFSFFPCSAVESFIESYVRIKGERDADQKKSKETCVAPHSRRA